MVSVSPEHFIFIKHMLKVMKAYGAEKIIIEMK